MIEKAFILNYSKSQDSESSRQSKAINFVNNPDPPDSRDAAGSRYPGLWRALMCEAKLHSELFTLNRFTKFNAFPHDRNNFVFTATGQHVKTIKLFLPVYLRAKIAFYVGVFVRRFCKMCPLHHALRKININNVKSTACLFVSMCMYVYDGNGGWYTAAAEWNIVLRISVLFYTEKFVNADRYRLMPKKYIKRVLLVRHYSAFSLLCVLEKK